jgi:uncharacterized membrane protein
MEGKPDLSSKSEAGIKGVIVELEREIGVKKTVISNIQAQIDKEMAGGNSSADKLEQLRKTLGERKGELERMMNKWVRLQEDLTKWK